MAVKAACCSILLSCQLADDPDPPKCEKGFHPELQRCVPNETTEKQIKITAAQGGTSCVADVGAQRPPVLDPETLTVQVNEQFQFDNADAMAHEIRGADGAVWVTVPPGKRSPFTSILKPGTWAYRVSGCTKGGTVVVQ
jgi:plastocyanin